MCVGLLFFFLLGLGNSSVSSDYLPFALKNISVKDAMNKEVLPSRLKKCDVEFFLNERVGSYI